MPVFHPTVGALMGALGFDRTYSSKLESKHGFKFAKTVMGYDECSARILLARAGVSAPVGPSQQVLDGMEAARAEPGDTVSPDADLPGPCDYDDLVKRGKISYALAKVREQVIKEKIDNESKRLELDKSRGALVTREDAERGSALVRDSLNQKFDRAIARALAALSDRLTPELRGEVAKAIESELDAE